MNGLHRRYNLILLIFEARTGSNPLSTMPIADFLDTSLSADLPIACDTSAIDDPEAHDRSTNALLSKREEMRKIDGGLAFRYPGTIDYARRILDFVEHERRCCPFLTFEIVFESESRAIWLVMGGDGRVEAFVESQFADRGP